MTRALPLLLATSIALTGCDQLGISGGGATTDTNMRSIDIQAGTASDEMIILDQASGDGTAIDTSVATGPATSRPADDNAADAASGSSDGEAAPEPATGDQVIRPPAGGAEPDSPPEPAQK